MNFSHQPGAGLSGVDAAWDEAERPVWIRITLSFCGDRVPQVSYAISKDGSGLG
jgi:hypothetical protein